jgi:superoxide reductase
MTTRGQIWKCNVCGNIIEILHEGADALVCCGQPMNLQEEHAEDPEKGEKHIPIIKDKTVKVGSIPHPMDEDHYIEWIEATSESGLAPCKKFLKPGDKPEIEFPFPISKARIYCNVHGLWKS